MATPTYDLLESVTLATAASSVTFSSIDTTTYTDIILVTECIGGSSSARLGFRFNGDTGSNYSTVITERDNSDSDTNTYFNAQLGSALQNSTMLTIHSIMDANATNKHKSIIGRANNADRGLAGMQAGRWANTSRITSITCLSYGADFLTASTFAIYGIVA